MFRNQADQPEDIPLDVVFEDETLLVINNPAGLVVHPGSGNWSGTLMNALLHHVPGIDQLPGPASLHRLDKDTSGPDGGCQDAGGADRSGSPVAGAHRQAGPHGTCGPA